MEVTLKKNSVQRPHFEENACRGSPRDFLLKGLWPERSAEQRGRSTAPQRNRAQQ